MLKILMLETVVSLSCWLNPTIYSVKDQTVTHVTVLHFLLTKFLL
jgi:hypothetical protein